MFRILKQTYYSGLYHTSKKVNDFHNKGPGYDVNDACGMGFCEVRPPRRRRGGTRTAPAPRGEALGGGRPCLDHVARPLPAPIRGPGGAAPAPAPAVGEAGRRAPGGGPAARRGGERPGGLASLEPSFLFDPFSSDVSS